MRTSDLHLLVVCGKDSPELSVLSRLPSNVKVHGPGKTVKELEGMSQEEWDSIEVLLNCGALKDAAKKDDIRVC